MTFYIWLDVLKVIELCSLHAIITTLRFHYAQISHSHYLTVELFATPACGSQYVIVGATLPRTIGDGCRCAL